MKEARAYDASRESDERRQRGGDVPANRYRTQLRREVGPMQEIIEVIGVILRAADIILKVLVLLKGKAIKRNHPHK